MSTPIIPEPELVANAWKKSGESWQGATRKALKAKKTLVLSGHGIQLKVERGALLVKDGMTHHPQEVEERTLYRGIHGVEQIVVVDPTGMITFDALKWCASQQISILVLYDEDGDLAGFSSIGGTGKTDIALRRAQYEALWDGKALALSRFLITQKLKAQIGFLGNIVGTPVDLSKQKGVSRRGFGSGLAIETAMERLSRYLSLVEGATAVEEVRQVESKASADYYVCLQDIPLRWSAKDRKLVPPHWLTVGGRLSGLMHKMSGPRLATTPTNAIRNMAFTYLAHQCRLAAAVKGFDVACGWLHADKRYRDSLVFDIMEPFRPAVDEKVLELVTSAKFTYGDFVETSSGQVKLHPALAKFVVSTCCIPWKSIDLSPVIKLLGS
jgi:CRISP-associated protein Cas1